MGLCAWVRAVALPLSALAIGYWLARRQKIPARRLLTGVGVVATLVVLLPWGIRHVRQSGSLYFTDDHGGITALIGANPNSEGTLHARAEPHVQRTSPGAASSMNRTTRPTAPPTPSRASGFASSPATRSASRH